MIDVCCVSPVVFVAWLFVFVVDCLLAVVCCSLIDGRCVLFDVCLSVAVR